MKKLTIALAALMIFALGTVAHAAEGFYAGVDLGYGIGSGQATHEGTNAPGTPDYDLEDSVVAGLKAGYAFDFGLRAGAEFRYREISTDSDYVNGIVDGEVDRTAQEFSVDADVESYTLMAVLYYDLDLGFVAPYIKAGLGVAFNSISADLDIVPIFDQFGIDRWDYPGADETSFAWEIGAGLSFELVENLYLDAEYQYLGMEDISTDKDVNGDWITVEDLGVHEITVGLRYFF